MDETRSRTVFSRLASLIILHGALLTLLLPVGMVLSPGGWGYRSVFLLSLVPFVGASVLAAQALYALARESYWPGWFLGILYLFVLAAMISGAALPITARDALVHHLAVPDWWIAQGRIAPVRWHEWSYYPMLLQLGFTGFLSFGLEWGTSLYHAFFLFLAASVLAVFFRTQRNATSSTVVALMVLYLPLCFRLGTEPLVDLGLFLFAAVALCAVLLWQEEKKVKLLYIAGLAAGLAAATKYNGFLFVLSAFPAFLIMGVRSKISLRVLGRASLIVAGGVAVFFLPWAIKNILWIDNPVYPFLKSFFGNQSLQVGIPGLPPLGRRAYLYHEELWEILLIPFRMLFFGEDNNPRYFDGVLHPFLVFALAPLIRIRRSPRILFLILLIATYTAVSLMMISARARYLIPILPAVLLLTGFGVAMLASLGKRWKIALMTGFLFGYLLLSGSYQTRYFHQKRFLPYAQGRLSEAEYLSDAIPEYSLIRYANNTLGKNTLVYLLYTGNQFFYYDIPVISGGYYSERLLLSWLRHVPTPEVLAKELTQRGVTHFLVHSGRLQSTLPTLLAERREREVWNNFQKEYLQLVHSEGAFSLWELKV